MDAQTQQQILALERLGISALWQRYAEVFGEGTKVADMAWLLKRVAGRLQALAEGDLSDRPERAPPNWPTTPTCGSTRRDRSAKTNPS
jgi:hypothetical protein